MSPRKRRKAMYEALSEDLKDRLLELAGIVVTKVGTTEGSSAVSNNGVQNGASPSESNAEAKLVKPKSSSMLREEAVKLKHRGDKVTGPVKHLIYLRAGLKFLEHALSLEKNNQSGSFRSTGTYISSIAEVAKREAEKATKKGDIEHFVILNYRMAAISFMKSFAIRSVKLKQVRDMLAPKLRKDRENKFTSGYDHLNYFVREMNDVLMSLHLWRKADEYAATVLQQGDPKVKKHIGSLPSIELYVDQDAIHPLIASVREAVNNMYS
mmetsp:Transcript_3699/g.4256  ORF Transcript_3699/g.4256 Transcript_3699/m.4256 type:complete len:267 (+) Transcript_3699:169-969(+)